jgi:wyosine [tRNA(Phe)-imidazoG37] synthetase (radical SAM superfamily)
MNETLIAFGPVPSRRLGYSLGINHIPPKHCPYSCVYCQVGRTTNLGTKRREFYPLQQILEEVERKILDCKKTGQKIDYLTLVPDGEPTLDINLGKLIEGLKRFEIPVAVISNASMIDSREIQDVLSLADWVSMKVDAVNADEWRRINRPNRFLSLPVILDGILDFRSRYRGQFVTETMLVSGINDSETSIHNLSTYLLDLSPDQAYLSLPIRPPAEAWVKPPGAESLQKVFKILSERKVSIALLFEAEESDFSSTGNLTDDILGITAVHPLREEALRKMIDRAGADWQIVEELLNARQLVCIQHQEERFYLRQFNTG